MPYEPDEIEEIKRLLENSVTGQQSVTGDSGAPFSPPDAGEIIPDESDAAPDVIMLSSGETGGSERPGTGKSGVPAATQRPGTGRSGVPATTQRPGTSRSGVPATTQKPGTGRSGVPATTQRPGTGRSGVPATTQRPGTGRSGVPAVTRKPGEEEISVRQRADRSLANRENVIDVDAELVIESDDQPDAGTARRTEPEPDTGPDKFKVKFDFDEVYIDVPEEKPLRLRREKRTGCIGGILYAAFVICISLVLASLVWMAAVDVLGFGEKDEQINVEVLQGFVIEDITDMLYDAGLIRYKFLFNLYANYSHAEEKISAGFYVLNMNYDYRALVQGMTTRAGERVERSAMIPEGYTMAQIFALLDAYGICPADELWEAAKNYNFRYSFLERSTLGDEHRLEGFLFPETYNFYIGSTPVQVLTKFLNEFNKRLTEQYTERAEFMGYSIREILTVASMIEREAGSDEERPRIAAVIYNRLNSDDFPHLQIDATIYYAIAGTGRLPSTDVDSPYNTYICEGLPPGPIANPGIASIRAALYPESTDEYYYALNRTGTHEFFRTRAQHEAFVQSDDYGG